MTVLEFFSSKICFSHNPPLKRQCATVDEVVKRGGFLYNQKEKITQHVSQRGVCPIYLYYSLIPRIPSTHSSGDDYQMSWLESSSDSPTSRCFCALFWVFFFVFI